MIHGSSRRLLQSIAASFGVWGYRNRFLRSIMIVNPQVWGSLKSKKKIETSFEIPFPLSRRSDRSDPVVGHFLTSLSYTFEGPRMMYDLIITFVFILYILE